MTLRRVCCLALLALAGCPKQDERLIEKLEAEQRRLAATPRDQVDALAELSQQPPDAPTPIQVRSAPVTLGALTVTPKRLETAQTIAGPKLKLSTTDRFARVVVSISSTADTTLDVSRAQLTRADATFDLARDVQRVGQGSPLSATVGAGVAQDLVLYFELPAAQVGPGLTLTLPSEPPLKVPLL